MTQPSPSIVPAQSSARAMLPAHDYVSPGLDVIMPDSAFPDLIAGDTAGVDWPFLRRWVEHTWYADRTSPTTGFIDRDEASLLYNNAKLFANQPSLEIGCWRGWSAVHIAQATNMLDVIDPLLEDASIAAKVSASFKAANVLERITLHPGSSPDACDALALSSGRRWSFIFIDGSHDGEGPSRDAEAAMRHAASTAMVMFHDLVCPDVAAALGILRDAGWRTKIYQTMQIMGVAWRGDVEPVCHTPDPDIFWTLPRHLAGYEVSGWTPPNMPKVSWWDGMTMTDRRNAAQVRAQTAEDDLLEARKQFAGSQADISDLREQIQRAHSDALGVKAQLNTALHRMKEAAAAADLAEVERNGALSRAEAAEANLARLADVVADMSAKISDAFAYQAERSLLLSQLDQANQELAAFHEVRADNEMLRHEYDALAARAGHAEARIELLQLTRAFQEAEVHKLRLANRRIADVAGSSLSGDPGLQGLAQWAARKRVILGLLRRPPFARIAIIGQQAEALGVGNAFTERSLHWIGRRRNLFGLLRRSGRFAELLIKEVLIEDAETLRRRTAESIGEGET